MTNTPTAHNSAKTGDFAKTVLMPGDPLRAKYIAETYLENPRQVTAVRNMFGYTGSYKGKEISVMGGGMGMPSIGIYSYELFNFYDVDQIIRIGSAGALQDHMKLMDVVIGMGACTDSNYAYQYGLPGTFAPIADYELLNQAVETAKRQGTNVIVGNVLSSDVFYNFLYHIKKFLRCVNFYFLHFCHPRCISGSLWHFLLILVDQINKIRLFGWHIAQLFFVAF